MCLIRLLSTKRSFKPLLLSFVKQNQARACGRRSQQIRNLSLCSNCNKRESLEKHRESVFFEIKLHRQCSGNQYKKPASGENPTRAFACLCHCSFLSNSHGILLITNPVAPAPRIQPYVLEPCLFKGQHIRAGGNAGAAVDDDLTISI